MPSTCAARSDFRRSRTAFTIIELLTIIGIIGVLMALVFPALFGVRINSGIATCANNLKQLGAATTGYLATYKDYLPQAIGQNPFTGQNEVIGTSFS